MTNSSHLLLDPDRTVAKTSLPNYRPGTAIVVCDKDGLVLVGKRAGQFQNPFQFPQGGIEFQESPRDACMRELAEETGVNPDETTILGNTPNWLSYEIPPNRANPNKHAGVGQVQAWFLLRWPNGHESDLAAVLRSATDNEFVELHWRTAAEALSGVVEFKRQAYQAALGYFKENFMSSSSTWDDLPS